MHNETLFREVNERIQDISAEVSGRDFIEFLCECGEEACLERIELTRKEYEEVRSVSDHFAMKPGHDHPDFERVIRHDRRCVIIEKVGQAAEIAHRTDPRA